MRLKMKKISKKIILLAMVLGIMFLPVSSVKAALQANGEKIITTNLEGWILPIRKMQEIGGTLGRTDVINTDNFTSNASDLDIHLQKNTEYGAMAILSASAYGNPNKINPGETTTGNPTGVVMNGNPEYTTGGVEGRITVSNYNLLSPRYKDIYRVSLKNGDAMDIFTWHGGTRVGDYDDNIFIRHVGSVFGYVSALQHSSYVFVQPWAARAAIVVGSDL